MHKYKIFLVDCLSYRNLLFKEQLVGRFLGASYKVTEDVFKKVLEKPSIYFQELEVVAIQIKAIVNSIPLFSDPHELKPLTFRHLSLGRRFLSLPQKKVTFP